MGSLLSDQMGNAWTNSHEWRQWLKIIPVNQHSYGRWVELGQPTMNLKRDDIQASSLQKKSVPVVVPHVQEPTVGSRTKERKVLHRIKHSLLLLHEHMYAHKNLNKTYRLLPVLLLWDILGGSPRTSGRAGGIASSYKKVNEIEIQYTMKHKLRNVQVINTITSINWDMHN